MKSTEVRTAPLLVLSVLMLTLSARTAMADDPAGPPLRWWKGNIHTHSLWSDGNDFPEMIADWYRTHDYHFLALSDHNVLSEGVRWMKVSDIARRGGQQALEKYLARFGTNWVETRGEPGTDSHQVRLKPLNEFRGLVEERQRFLMIQGEEISDSVQGKPVHMNATNIHTVLRPVGGTSVREAMANNLRAVQEQADRVGRPILLHLNHPNFGKAVTAEDLALVTEERFFEVYNGHPAVGHLGDADVPGVERIWDLANTMRLNQLHAAPLYGVGVDDSHTYHGQPGSHPGRGWVMVRARFLTPESIIRAMKEGDFYASSGVTLQDVVYDPEQRTLAVEVLPEDGVTYRIQFLGSVLPQAQEREDSPTRTPVPEIGKVLATVEGTRGRYSLNGEELFVRAVVTSSRPHPDPSFDGQHEQAWTQPVGWNETLLRGTKAP